jgi:hypothetical protein
VTSLCGKALPGSHTPVCACLCAAVKQPSSSSSLWLAANPSKRWAEVFFLAYSPFWILWALCILVPFQLYEVITGYSQVQQPTGLAAAATCTAGHSSIDRFRPVPRPQYVCRSAARAASLSQYCDEWGYLMIGLAACVPCWVLPLLLPNKVCWSCAAAEPAVSPTASTAHSTTTALSAQQQQLVTARTALGACGLAFWQTAVVSRNSVLCAVCLLFAVRLMQASPGTPGSGSR